MRNKNRLKGLLSFAFQAAKGNLKIAVALSLLSAIVLLVTGIAFFYNIFVMMTISVFPYVIMMGMGGKNSYKWERFQIAMPIKRSDLVNSQYLSVCLAPLAGIPVVMIVTKISFILYETIFDYAYIQTVVASLAIFLSMPLLMAGLLFPLACTKVGESRGEMLFSICLLVAIGNVFLMQRLGVRLEWSGDMIVVMALAVALVVFVISYFIVRRIYAKVDF